MTQGCEKVEAACFVHGVDSEIFYTGDPSRHDEAIRICGACAMKERCLKEALELPANSDSGIKGGLTRDQRQRLRNGSNAQ